jgi:uncharacterized phage protein (TIGR01671 family)
MIPKFRAWLKNDKEMIDVDEIHWFNGELDIIGDYITFVRKADEIELMQSTGLKDKNGKEIFEGDIVDYKGREAVVKWHGSYASFIYRFVDGLLERVSEWDPLFLAYYNFEVMGNIYENPELLEVKDE